MVTITLSEAIAEINALLLNPSSITINDLNEILNKISVTNPTTANTITILVIIDFIFKFNIRGRICYVDYVTV